MFEDFEDYNGLNVNGVIMPAIPIDQKYKVNLGLKPDVSQIEFLRELTYKGLREKGLYNEKYKARCDTELKTFDDLLYVDYILAVWDICNFADENLIPRGPGRGSCAGSLVLYALKVTEIDSLKYDLYFERFVSKSRAKTTEIDGIIYFDGSLLCDIDLDFEYVRRQEVLKYIEQKYPNQTAKILTINTMAGKACMKDVMKIVGGFSEEEANEISDLIPKIFGQVKPLAEAYLEVEKLKEFCDKNPEVYKVALKLENLKKNYSVHPSGVAISSGKIKDIMPTQLTGNGDLVTAIDMKWTAEIAVKFDILGLRTLTVVDECCKMVGIKREEIDPEDPFIYTALQVLDCPKGIFQIEADSQYRACKQIKPANFSELSDLMAICRPGAIDYIGQYVEVKQDPESLPSIEPKVDKLLLETKGVLLYQELLMKVGNQVFGLTLDESETLRRIVGKKKVKEMEEWHPKIYDAAKKLGLKESVADFYWKALSDSASYSFNKSHSASYAYLAATTIYLKFKYPVQFFCALLNCCKFETKPQEEIEKICAELHYFGIQLLPPSLVSSQENFCVEGKNIRYGLNSIKGGGDKSIQSLLDFRGHRADNKYQLFSIAKDSGINIGLMSSLIQCGCLDDFGTNRCKTVLEAQTFNVLTDREKRLVTQLGPQYDYQLLECIAECHKTKRAVDGEKPLFTETRWETFFKKYNQYKAIYVKNNQFKMFANWYFERSLLGYTYSCNLKECFQFSKYFSLIKDLTFFAKGDKVSVIGIVTDSMIRKSKKTDNKYLKVVLQDETGAVTVMAVDTPKDKKMTKILESSGPFKKDSIISIIGQKSDDTIFIEKLEVLDEKIYMKLSQLKND